MAKKKRGPIKDPITFTKAVMRRASYRQWYAHNEVLKQARTARGIYQCAHCKGSFKKAQLQVDHIDPVVDVKKGYESLEEYALRLFVPPEKLSALCVQCHSIKSSLENEMRQYYKKAKKKKK